MSQPGNVNGLLVPLILPVMDLVHAIPGVLGLHQVRLTLKSWLWTAADGGHRMGTGTPVPRPDLVIGAVDWRDGTTIVPPHVEGTSGDPEVDVDYISIAWFTADGVTQLGGFTSAQLNPPDAHGLETQYELAWPAGPRRYVLGPRGLTTHKSLRYRMHLVADDRRVPF
jgi:hypothetical protein